jgi:hypothetical protein
MSQYGEGVENLPGIQAKSVHLPLDVLKVWPLYGGGVMPHLKEESGELPLGSRPWVTKDHKA